MRKTPAVRPQVRRTALAAALAALGVLAAACGTQNINA